MVAHPRPPPPLLRWICQQAVAPTVDRGGHDSASRVWGSDARHRGWSLTRDLRHRYLGRVRVERMAGWTGLEPATSDVTGRRSNQLNYHPAKVVERGGRCRVRTCGPRCVRPMLYR